MSAQPRVVMPDAELVVIAALAAARPTARVLATLPGDLRSQVPLVQVQRTGGSVRIPLVLDEARLDVDCFAPTRAAAAALAAEVRADLASLAGTTSAGALVVSVLEDVGPSWRPDPLPDVRRFGMAVRITYRPA